MANLPKRYGALLLKGLPSNGPPAGSVKIIEVLKFLGLPPEDYPSIATRKRVIEILKGLPAIIAAPYNGDVIITAAGRIENIIGERDDKLSIELEVNSILPSADDDAARLLTVIRLSVPQYVEKKIFNAAFGRGSGSGLKITFRDYQIIQDGDLFYVATVLQSLTDAFPDPLRSYLNSLQFDFRRGRHGWHSVLDLALKKLTAEIIGPAVIALKVVEEWGELEKSLEKNKDKNAEIFFKLVDDNSVDSALKEGIRIERGETKELVELFGAAYNEGTISSKLVDEIREKSERFKKSARQKDFLKRFIYPGRLKL